MSFKINLEELKTSQLRAVFISLRHLKYDFRNSPTILVQLEIALIEVSETIRALESGNSCYAIEVFIPAEFIPEVKSNNACWERDFLEVFALHADAIHPVTTVVEDFYASDDNVEVSVAETTTNLTSHPADAVFPVVELPEILTGRSERDLSSHTADASIPAASLQSETEGENSIISNGQVNLNAEVTKTSVIYFKSKVVIKETAESQNCTFGSRDQKSRDFHFINADSHLVTADEFLPAMESANSSLCPIYLFHVSICSSTGGGDLLVQLCSGVAEANLRPERKPPWLFYHVQHFIFQMFILCDTICTALPAAVYFDAWTLIISYAACFMPIDPFNYVLGLIRSLLFALSDKPRQIQFNRGCICYALSMVMETPKLAFVSRVLYALVRPFPNLGPNQVYQ